MIYNHKSEENVQDVVLECICHLIEDVVDEFDMLRRYDALHLYLPSWLAREIVGRILDEIDGLWVHEESYTELLCKDDNEVIITIAYDGMVFIEEARGTKGQLKDGDGVVNYVYDGFKQKDIEKLTSDDCPVLVFGFEEEEIEETDVACKEETKPSTSTASYTVNGKPVTKEEFDKKYEEFENKYLDNVRDMLLRYCDLMDTFNEFLKIR